MTRLPPITYVSLLMLAAGALAGGVYFKYVMLLLAPWGVFSTARNFAVPEGGLLFFVYLYTLTYPTFLILGGEYQGLDSLLIVANLSLFGFLLGLLICAGKLSPGRALQSDTGFIFHEWIGVRLRLIIALLTLVIIILVFSSGMQSKREVVYGVFGYFSILLEFLYLFFTIALFFLCSRLSEGIPVARPLALFLVCGFLLMFTIGERDILFKFVFVALTFFMSLRENSFKILHYLVLLILALSVMSLSQQLKSILLSGQLQVASETGVRWLFYNEFSSGLRNLHFIILLGGLDGATGLIWGDVLRFFRADLIVSDGIASGTQWFNDIYRVAYGIEGTAGWGFGLVSEFYISGGIWGVLIGFFALGAIISILSLKLWTSVAGRVFLFIVYASLIYSLRADIANLLALSIKWALIPYCFLRVMFFLFARIRVRSM